MSREQDNKAIVGRWFEGFWGNPWNPEIIDELATPDMLLQYSLHAPRRGRENVRNFMEGFRAAFPDLNFWADRLDNGKPGPHRPLGIVLVGLGIAEIDQHSVAHVFGDKAGEPGDRVGDRAVIRADHLAQILGVEAPGQRRRANQIAEHNRKLPPLGIADSSRDRGGCRWRFGCAECGDRVEQGRWWPTAATPISLRSSDVSFGSTSQSISLSRKAGA